MYLPETTADSSSHRTRSNAIGALAACLCGAALLPPRRQRRGGLALPALVATAACLRFAARRPAAWERVGAMMEALERKDGYTAGHCSRVAAFADLIADELGLRDARRRRQLRLAALLHDLGKLDVPLEVLHKPGRLDEAERRAMQAHVEAGIRRTAALGSAVRRIVAQHHERMDGKGYPRGLPGEAIALEARIVAVADAFDAMTSNRPYREAIGADAAFAEIVRCTGARPNGGQFDPAVVDALGRCLDRARRLCTEPPAEVRAA